MADIFLSNDACKLLENKYMIILGDSVQRSVYKDLVCLLQMNKYMTDAQLRSKGEIHCLCDNLVEGGKFEVMNNGPGYREVREYHTDYHLIKFIFITRCYNAYVEKVLDDMKNKLKPNVVLISSCLWDITRYGRESVMNYKKNLGKLCDKLKATLPSDCLVIWNTTLPISKEAKGGFLVPEVEFMTNTMRLDILQANLYSQQVMIKAKFDVLDIHYYLRHQLHRRAGDGIHWDMNAHRRITNLLLTHIADAMGHALPGNVEDYVANHPVKNEKDCKSNNNDSEQDNLKIRRPKITARRRKNDKRRVVTTTNTSRAGRDMHDNNNVQFDFASSIRPPDVNLPAMVDTMERYGGPVHNSSFDCSPAGVLPYHGAGSPMIAQSACFDNIGLWNHFDEQANVQQALQERSLTRFACFQQQSPQMNLCFSPMAQVQYMQRSPQEQHEFRYRNQHFW